MRHCARTVRVYDNGGKTADRYTIIPPKHATEYRERSGLWLALGCDAHPARPMGIGQHSTAEPGKHLGKRITWAELPHGAKEAAAASFPEYVQWR